MKAVILGSRGTYSAALLSDGSIEKIKNRGYRTGQEIEYQIGSPIQKPSSRLRRVIVVAALLLLLCSVGIWVYVTPYAHVNVDAAPSVRFTVNWFRRVIALEGVNDSGEGIALELANAKLLHASIEQAVEQAADRLVNKTDATTGQEILITVAAKNEGFAKRLADALQNSAAQLQTEGTLRVMGMTVTEAYAKQAYELKVSPGKYALMDALEAAFFRKGESFDRQAWMERSVQEITEAIRQRRAKEVTAETGGERNEAPKTPLPDEPQPTQAPQTGEPPLQKPEKPAVPFRE